MIEPFTLPTGTVLRKVSPLARWRNKEVWAYARQHDIPLLPLRQVPIAFDTPNLTFADDVRVVRFAADGDLEEHVRTYTQTTFHPTSTCAMGTGEDAVVDAELRVRGVDGLRVVDASVMPTVPRGNTNAPTIAIAEKAADLIRSNQ